MVLESNQRDSFGITILSKKRKKLERRRYTLQPRPSERPGGDAPGAPRDPVLFQVPLSSGNRVLGEALPAGPGGRGQADLGTPCDRKQRGAPSWRGSSGESGTVCGGA